MVTQSLPGYFLVGQAENAVGGFSVSRIRPDVTIMDQRLPGASGADALIAIRKGTNLPTILAALMLPLSVSGREAP